MARRLFLLALFSALPFALLHLAGLRRAVAALSGQAVPGLPGPLAMMAGGGYAAAWMLLVVAAPTLLLAAGLEALWSLRALRPRSHRR